jgi:hypothetical protein
MAWHDDAELDRAAALEIARTLDHPRRAFGTRVTTAVKHADGAPAGVRDAHVWHCSLNLRAEEGALPDERWARIAEEFVNAMGFTDGEYPCRWAAVRHGPSKAGNDHVHLVVSLVHEDGRKANVWNDRPRAQQACGELERRHGLEVLESRSAERAGARGHKPAERARAERHGDDELARDRLARVVRGCAAAAVDEAEFVRRVRQAGVRLRPRYASGRDDVIVGYSAALAPPPGQAPVWYGGGHLARDLTLPRLRSQWPDRPDAASSANAEWRAARRNQRPVVAGREQQTPDPEMWTRYSAELEQLRERLHSVPADDLATWAQVARETSGAFAAWSLRSEPTPGPLAATPAELARSAQLQARREPARPVRLTSPGGVAMLLASASLGGRGLVGQLALLRQLARTAQALHDAHVAAGQARSAQRLESVVREHVAHVSRELHAAAAAPTSGPGATPRSPGSPVPGTLPDRTTTETRPARPAPTGPSSTEVDR